MKFSLSLLVGATVLAAAVLAPAAGAKPPALEPAHQVADGLVLQCRHGQHDRRAARLAVNADGGWVRIDAYLDAGGPPAYEVLDDCVRQADTEGRVMVTLLNLAPRSDRPALLAPEIYALRIGELATRYRGQVDAYEVWNEPNHPLFWPGGKDPVGYARLLTASYHAIKTADPEALVVMAGTSSIDLPYIETVLQAGAPFDVLGVHPYEEPLMAAPGTTVSGFAALPELRWLMLRYGHRQPVWVTEFGWPGGGFLPEAWAFMADRSYLEAAFVYSWEAE